MMQEQIAEQGIEQKLVESIDQIRAWVESTAGPFVVEQTPLLVQDILLRPWIHLSIALTVMIPLLALTWLWGRMRNVEDKEIAGVFLGGAWLAWIIPTIFMLNDAVSAYFTPRLYVLEQLRGML